MIKAGIIGATGYAGANLVSILKRHKEVEVSLLSSNSYVDKAFNHVYPSFLNLEEDKLVKSDIMEFAGNCDVVFLALPHGIASGKINNEILNKTKIIDLGADFRLNNKEVYEKWYEVEHYSPHLLEEAVYGLCEINRDKIKKATLVANPGCYTTCSILSLYPLVKEGLIDVASIIIDAKSGVSGAGRGLNQGSLYCECNESIKAYKVASHRHTPEIEQELSKACGKDVFLTFTPHLVPMDRGILAVSYATIKEGVIKEDILNSFNKYYKDEKFIRIRKSNDLPQTGLVKGSNYVDIGFEIDDRTNRVIVIGALDNLMKGAASQAVQNMNIMFNFKEDEGIDFIPLFP